MERLHLPLPLQAAKGYSFSVTLERPPSHPLYMGDKQVVASPINGAVRIAGDEALGRAVLAGMAVTP